MHITAKIPVMSDRLTKLKRVRLEALTGRDSTVIQQYLEILQKEGGQLLKVKDDGTVLFKIDKIKLDEMTLTSRPLTRANKQTGEKITHPGRPTVIYDLKKKFNGKISVRELKECRDTAVEMWNRYLSDVEKHQEIYWKIVQNPKYIDREEALVETLRWWETEKRPTPPCSREAYKPKKLPRRATLGTTAWVHTDVSSQLTSYWLEIYYTVRSRTGKGKKARRIWLPLSPSSYHQDILTHGTPKTAALIKDRETKRWYVHVSIDIPIPEVKEEKKPIALISLDLGAKKDATAVLLTSDRQPVKPGEPPKLTKKDIRFFVQPKKKELINKLDNQIASLQKRRDLYKQLSEDRSPHDYQKVIKNVHRKLKSLRTKRQRIARQLDHELVNRVLAWAKQLEEKYTVYLVVGRLKGIRNRFRKGQGTSRPVRRELHQWAYARLTALIQYKLYRIGLPASRLRQVSEAYTSQTCHKCGSQNTRRPFQSLLICEDCGANLQADINGAMNIALRLIVSMLEINALDQWLRNPLMTRKLELLAQKKRRASGRKNTTKKQHKQKQPTLPLISSPKSGIETPPL